MSWSVRVIAGRYADSVRLMQIAQSIRERDGVGACEVAMGTPANLAALAALGASASAGPMDVVIAVDAPEADAPALLDAAAQALASAVTGGHGQGPTVAAPTTIQSAAAGANVALISVSGEYATLASHQALSAGMHVFLFSDHVSVEDEVALKERGRDKGLFVMGPGCGTAMLAGVGLGFANVVRRGRVGVVAAAGTGAQEVACLLDEAGIGVSEIIGVGGRDLSEAVGGIMFREAMRALVDDPETDSLLLVSKPPSPEVVRSLGDAVPAGIRVVAAFVGWEGGEAPFEVHATLEAGVAAIGGLPLPETDALTASVAGRASGRRLLGLYSGGSLAYEAVTILEPLLGQVGGNAGHAGPDARHTILDLGEEEYTQGRPHPMVDLEVRLGLLEEAAADPEVGCVLMDVVLGHGAHADPATGLAEAIRAVAAGHVVIVHVCGTEGDPQVASRQRATLAAAGAVLAPSNAAAARAAAAAVS